jgi:hypothetical protein
VNYRTDPRLSDRAFFIVTVSVLAVVIGLVTAGLYESASSECDSRHGVLVRDAWGFGWDCVREAKP